MDIYIAGVTYPTKTAALENARGFLAGIPHDEPLDGFDLAGIMDICWAGAVYRVDAAWVKSLHGAAEGSYELHARVDGVWKILSVKKVIMGAKPSTDRHHLTRALRGEVQPQIEGYRDSQYVDAVPTDPVTGSVIERSDSDVDHVLPFSQIVTDWMTTMSLTTGDIQLDPPRVSGSWRLTDRNLASSWQTYHAAHATLRLLSRASHRAHTRAQQLAHIV